MANRSEQNKDREIRLSETQMRQPGMEVGARRVADSEATDLAEEYSYVVRDLSRIGIIAAVMLAILVGLAFLL